MDPKQTKVNIIIPKRDRNEFLGTCLHYLNLACSDPRFKVTVCVSDDSAMPKHPEGTYENFRLVYLPFRTTGLFNKSRLINNALARMPADYDWFSIVDVDMVYASGFLEGVLHQMRLGSGYVVSHGYKMNKELSSYVAANKPPIEYVTSSPDKEEFRVGPSQISMTPDTYNMFKKAFGDLLYDEFYEGWGAEDSDISFKSTFFQSKKLLQKSSIYGVWYHLYHESRNVNNDQYKKNYHHFMASIAGSYKVILNNQGGESV